MAAALPGVVKILTAADVPGTNRQGIIHQDMPVLVGDKLRYAGFRAPLQVYRALDKLLEFGLVHRLESINAFVACAHPDENCHAHGITAFTICETCGKVTEFHDHMIEDRLKGFAKDRNFKTGKTTIEIRGTCAGCA